MSGLSGPCESMNVNKRKGGEVIAQYIILYDI